MGRLLVVLKRLRAVVLFVPIAGLYFLVSAALLLSVPLLYVVLCCKGEKNLYRVRSVVVRKNMPLLRPIPTATAGQVGFWNKLLAYMFVPRRWQLMQDWRCPYRENRGTADEKAVVLVVPKGFVCDAASIPRPFRALLNPSGALLLPALLHDYAFKYNQLWQEESGGFAPYFPEKDFDKKESVEQMVDWDRFLYEAGQQLNGLWPVNATIRYLGWIGLTEPTWKRYRRHEKPMLSPAEAAPAGDVCAG